jgi:predicted GNAT family N-acyltransferase
MNEIIIKEVDFNKDFYKVKEIRTEVFIKEQHVPVELEWDEYDKTAVHILAYYNDLAVGTARLLPDAHIGRMAVLKSYRFQHVGKKMLEYLMSLAHKNGMHSIELSAQKHALEFYLKSGFHIVSDEYLDAGIPHFTMKIDVV